MISALFVTKNSIYKELNIDSWDIDRDARLWPGGNPCIAHPPCRAWGQLSHFAKPRPDEKELAIWAINQIRIYGGILEHPRGSKLWPHLNLPLGSEIDSFGGFTISICQSWFGHPCEKKTLLYICGCSPCELPEYPLSFDAVKFVISTKKTRYSRPEASKKYREYTPINFAKWLIDVANKCKKSYI